MNTRAFQQLHEKGFIDDESLRKIEAWEKNKVISVHWELKTMLYIGILLLTTGVGILVYKNIDTIGHLAIVIFIAASSAGCFAYCINTAKGFSYNKVESPDVWFDYVLLLGCLLLLTFIGYLQFEYEVFSNRWGLAAFIPMVILFTSAYFFDHLGVLGLAITNFAAWLGLTITPIRFLQDNDFGTERIIFTGLLLAVILTGMGILSFKRNLKKHFSFTYKNFGTHILFVSLIAAIIHFDPYFLLWFVFLAAATFYHYITAVKERSLYFIMLAAIYFYVGLSYVIVKMLMMINSGEGVLYLSLLYLIASAVGFILFLIHQNKRLKTYAGLR